MKQHSNIKYRAEKEYKNAKAKFYLLLREIISNSLHALIIRKSKNLSLRPKLSLDIKIDDKMEECEILLTDNGEGFTAQNVEYFNELDKKNIEKEQHKFHPLGQGRLALVYFTDKSIYETVYKNKTGEYVKREFQYPPIESTALFTIDDFKEESVQYDDSYTKLHVKISKQQTYRRAKTFFSKYSDIDKLKYWTIETFFPFIVTEKDLIINLSYNGAKAKISKDDIDTDKKPIVFKVTLQDREYEFELRILPKDGKLSGVNNIECFARNLKAELEPRNLTYTIDSEVGYGLYLTSDFFDENVDLKGDKIEISEDDVEKINYAAKVELDNFFADTIKLNRKKTKDVLTIFRKRYPSLDVFVQTKILEERTDIVTEADLVKNALNEKGRIEKKFWLECEQELKEGDIPFADTDEGRKLLNSTLQVYVKHREMVLKQLDSLIHLYDDEGNIKPEAESKIHNLLLKRGVCLDRSSDINHLHNLWILDDKYTVFSNDFLAQSSKQGQALSDIYIWADDPKKTKEVLILELKSTTKAHNAGGGENMVTQVKRYARSFYLNPHKYLNWNVNTSDVLFSGIILANKRDVNKELTSLSSSGKYYRIPFLKNSYVFNEAFCPYENQPMNTIDIRVELYSYEDISDLASQRNEVFFKLLKNEYNMEKEEELIGVANE
ncbi:MAG: ATP-binding protein [Alistipes sp.]|nr:ATP-binding protein [Alistipes sp.]MBR6550677.1 ATP-binding protein [Paludibacteraceae bacterium]